MDDKFEEISIEDMINILVKRRKLIALTIAGFLILGLVQSFIITKPRYASSVSLEVNNLEPVVPKTEDTNKVYNVLDSITHSADMKFEDYLKEITSDVVLEKTIKDLKLQDTYSTASLKSSISVSSNLDSKNINLRIVEKNSKRGGEILEKLSENFAEHITSVSQENSTKVLEIIEEQMKIEKQKYSEAIEEYRQATKGKKSVLELELELQGLYDQLTEYKLSLNDLEIRKDGIEGALKENTTGGNGMILRPSGEGGNIYLDTGKNTLKMDLAETDARIVSTKSTIKNLQTAIEDLKTDYQEAQFNEGVISQKVELTKQSYEIFAMKHQELSMQSSMDIGGISIAVLTETISENKPVGTRKAIKLGVSLILGIMAAIILSFVVEYIQNRKNKKISK